MFIRVEMPDQACALQSAILPTDGTHVIHLDTVVRLPLMRCVHTHQSLTYSLTISSLRPLKKQRVWLYKAADAVRHPCDPPGHYGEAAPVSGGCRGEVAQRGAAGSWCACSVYEQQSKF